MSFTSASIMRARGGLAALALAALLGFVMLVASASATPQNYNDADVIFRGGDAAAFSVCLNVAKAKAKAIKRTGKDNNQENKCDNVATAIGGEVDMDKVNLEIKQQGKSKKRSNSADIVFQGGDAVAVAACINVAQGTYDNEQLNKCTNDSFAQGGNVKLEHVDVTLYQS